MPPTTWGPIRRAVAITAGVLTLGFWGLVMALLAGVAQLVQITVMVGLVVAVHGRVAYGPEFSRRYGSWLSRRLRPLGRMLRLAARDMGDMLRDPMGYGGSSASGRFASQYAAYSIGRGVSWFVATMTWFPVRDLVRAVR